MKREISAGGVVFNKEGQVLLASAGSLRDRSKLHWKFPKGHLEGGETSEQAALREVMEETGVEAEIVSKLGVSKYTYMMGPARNAPHSDAGGEKIFKIVTYFIMKFVSGELKPQIGEIDEVKWVEVDEALKTLSFSIDKKLLQKAIEIKNG